METLNIYDHRWVEFVHGCPKASPFHNPVWAALLAECYNYRAFGLALCDGTGRIVGGIPVLDVSRRLTGRRWISLPFTDYCPALVTSEQESDLTAALIEEASLHRVKELELRTGAPERPGIHARLHAVRHTTALSTDTNAVYGRFQKMHKRNITKAERSGVCIAFGQSNSDVRTFYRLHLMTRRRLGVPVQPLRFFDLLSRRLIERDLGFILTAYINNTPAASAVFLHWNGTLVYKYGASDHRLWEYRPNNLLFREAIRWGCERGYHTFDWGRTDLDDDGLRDFKSGWGAIEEPLIYSTIADAPPKVSSGWIKKALGTVIRRSPLSLCRATGELFYGYTA